MIPNLSQLIATAMRALVRRGIWMLPKPVFYVLLCAALVASYFYGGKH